MKGASGQPQAALDQGSFLRTCETVGGRNDVKRCLDEDVAQMEAITCDKRRTKTFIKFWTKVRRTASPEIDERPLTGDVLKDIFQMQNT